MVLADTSVCVGTSAQVGFCAGATAGSGSVPVHPIVIGELACGDLKNRGELLDLLQTLPSAPVASAAEALTLIEIHRLMGRGVGYLDVHLLAFAALAQGARIWTHDAPMRAAATRLLLAFDPAG